MTDKNTGKKFYYNTVTRKTQWTLPKATAVAEQVNVESDRQTNDHTSSTATAESRSDWKEMTDKNSGKTFYYNVKTRKTQWEKPAEFETSGRAKKTSNADISGSESMDKGATNEAGSESVIAAGKTTTSHPTGDWISRTDPNTQRVYYFNKRTNKTQWEEPVEMQTAPTEDRGKATVETSLNAESADKDASEWKEMTDKTSGRKFYYNVNTKKTQWNKPLEVPSKPALIAAQKEASSGQSTTPAKQDQTLALTSSWTKRKDKKSGRYFYYNSETKKTQWETPVDFVENSAVEEKSDKTSAIDPISEAPKNDKNQKKKKKEKKKKEEDNLKSNEAQSSGSSLSDWTEKN